MYGYYEAGWMIYAIIELVSFLDIIISLIVLIKKISYDKYSNDFRFHIPFGIGILTVGLSRGIRLSTSDLLDIYFLDIKYLIIQLITISIVFGLRYLIKRRG